MARQVALKEKQKIALNKHQSTSIGLSSNSKPKNKKKKANWKPYRGQGK